MDKKPSTELQKKRKLLQQTIAARQYAKRHSFPFLPIYHYLQSAYPATQLHYLMANLDVDLQAFKTGGTIGIIVQKDF